jgi:hypothetical protein
MTGRKVSPLRKALAAKQVLTTYYDLPLVPRATIDKLIPPLEEARRSLLVAPYTNGTATQKKAAVNKAAAAVEDAKAKLDACFYRVEFRGLPGDDDLDALINAYPATPEQIEKAKAAGAEGDDVPQIDMDPFNVAYLHACVVDSDLTEDEWREELWSDRWTPADRRAIFDRVHQANQRAASDGIPNG